MATIAWIGLGNMGGPMSANLVKAGHTVRGFDVSAPALEAAAAKGVTRTPSIAEAVDGVDVIFAMLPKGQHVKAAMLGDDGVMSHAKPGLLIIDSSTIDVATSQEMHDAAQERGLRFVDAPVSGGISGAAAGTLTFMIGGAPADVEEARTYIEPMAGNMFNTGGPTTGEAAKICNNMMLFIESQACAEGAVLARKLGLDEKVFFDIVNVSSGGCWSQRTWWPVPGLVESAASNNEFAPTFAAALAHKDIGLAMDAAHQVGLELPAATVVAQQLQRVMDDGYGNLDSTIVIRNIDPEAPGVPKEA